MKDRRLRFALLAIAVMGVGALIGYSSKEKTSPALVEAPVELAPQEIPMESPNGPSPKKSHRRRHVLHKGQGRTTLMRATPIAHKLDPRLKRLSGFFSGTLKERTRESSVLLRSDWVMKGGRLHGSYLIEVTETGGNAWLKRIGDGANKIARLDPRSKTKLTLEVSSDAFFVLNVGDGNRINGAYVDGHGREAGRLMLERIR